jgi:hypothetical protein
MNFMQMTPLEQSIFRTLAWFSLFHYPMTRFEIWKWMIQPERVYGLEEVYRVLDQSEWLGEKIQSSNGFVVIKGCGEILGQVEDRQRRFLDAVHKFQLLRRACSYFRLIPGVRAVCAVNTLAWFHTTPESDIDLYIVVKPKQIWSTRLLLVAPFAALRLRPREGALHPFCFSFFATNDSLQLDSLRVDRDYYLAFWSKTLVPVLDRDGVMGEFAQTNRWAEATLPHAKSRVQHPYHTTRSIPAIPLQSTLLDPICRSLQRSRLPSEIAERANLDSCVIVTDQMLKFHHNDRRAEYRDQFEELVGRHL